MKIKSVKNNEPYPNYCTDRGYLYVRVVGSKECRDCPLFKRSFKLFNKEFIICGGKDV